MVAERRRAEFSVLSDAATGAELVSCLGSADFLVSVGDIVGIRGRPAEENEWSVVATGDGDVAIEELLERVLARVRPVRPALTTLTDEGARVILRIVAYFTPDDAVGQGFALRAKDLAFLAEVGAVLDVDQYCSSA